MTNLNEDVLRLIFDYLETPIEWIQVSEVCQLWKRAAEKNWRKITEINYLDKKWNDQNNAQVISSKDADRILHFAAPFVTTLIGLAYFVGKEKSVKFGPFLYKVKGFKADTVLKQLAQKATKITKIYFDRPPRAQLLTSLMKTNNIRNVSFLECDGFHQNVPTDEIVQLNVCFNSLKNVKSFEGHFANLQTLNLTIDCKVSIDAEKMLSPILPHVLGLTSIYLYVKTLRLRSVPESVLSHILKLSHLETLYLNVKIDESNLLPFFKKLASSFPRLRKFEFDGPLLGATEVLTLLTLPRLEKLKMYQIKDFPSMDLPMMTNLIELEIEFFEESLDVRSFCNALKMMPNLMVLVLPTGNIHHLLGFIRHETLELIYEVVTLVTSRNQNVVMMIATSYSLNERCSKLRISKLNSELSDVKITTFNLRFHYLPNDTNFFECIKTFVRTKLKDYEVSVEYADCDHH